MRVQSRLRAVEDALSAGVYLMAAPTAKPSLAKSVAQATVEKAGGIAPSPVKLDGLAFHPVCATDSACVRACVGYVCAPSLVRSRLTGTRSH